jgi:hypothetical protein
MLVDLLMGLLHIRGILGHTWDWNIPLYPQQYLRIFLSNLYLWNPSIRGGYPSIFTGELPYWAMLLLLSPLGGERISHLVPLLCIFVSFATMYLLINRFITKDRFWIAAGAALYALSPFQYLRIVAGHFTISFGYSLLPLILYLLISVFSDDTFRRRFRNIILLVMLSVCLGGHILNMIIGLFLIAMCAFMIPRRRIARTDAKLVMAGTLLLITVMAYWIYPLAAPFLTTGTIKVRQNETISQEVSRRGSYFDSVSQSIADILTSQVHPGLNTEYVYPTDDIRLLFVPVSILVAIVAFASIMFLRQAPDRVVLRLLYLTCLLGLGLSSGSGNLVGEISYAMLYRFVGPVFAAVSNPLRLLPIFYLSLAPLFAFSLSAISSQMRKRTRFSLYGFTLLILAIFFYPWLFRPMDKPVDPSSSQPLSLKINRISPSDSTVYRKLVNDARGDRIAFLPPAFLSWPGDTDHGFSWNTSAFPSDSFMEYPDHALAKLVADDLFGISATTGLSKLMGLANVKTIIFPQYDYFESYTSYIQKLVNYAPRVKHNWEKQSGFTQVEYIKPDILVFDNTDNLPRIYVPEFLHHVGGDGTAIRDAVTFSDYQAKSAFVDGDIWVNDVDNNPISIDAYTSKAVGSDQFINESAYKYLLNPSVRYLPDSPLYPYVTWRENRTYMASAGDPVNGSDILMLHMGKRLTELERLFDKEDSDEGTKRDVLNRYSGLLRLLSEQYRKISYDTVASNDSLKKMSALSIRHESQLRNLLSRDISEPLVRQINSIRNSIEKARTDIDSRIWADDKSGTKRMFLDIPVGGVYGLHIRNDGVRPLNITIDDSIIGRSDRVDGEWVQVSTLTLTKGLHRVEVSYPGVTDLFTGFGDSNVDVVVSDDPAKVAFRASDRQETVCSNQMVLSGERKYELTFDYLQTGEPMAMSVHQDSDEVVDGQQVHTVDSVLSEKNQWRHFRRQFIPGIGNGLAEICFVIPYADESIPTYEISNISIRPLQPVTLIARHVSNSHRYEKPRIEHVRIDPTRYRVSVKGAKTPFLLVFSENFDRNWKAYTYRISSSYGDSSEAVPENLHYQANLFANAWMVDKKGDYDVEIRYVPQRYYSYSLILSTFAFATCALLLFVMSKRERTSL